MMPTKTQTKTVLLEDVGLEDLIEATMNAAPTERVGAIDKWLETKGVSRVESLLPEAIKNQAERFCRSAAMYIRRGSPLLLDCTAESIVRCVLDAASFGFALDGRLAYAVPRKNRYTKPDGSFGYRYEASCDFDYKALLAFAKRAKIILDGWSRVVVEGDDITIGENESGQFYAYYPDLTQPRDNNWAKTLGILTVCKMPDGTTHVDWMPRTDVEGIRNRSQSYKSNPQNSPWSSDPGEMGKKSGLRRVLKTKTEDGAMAFMLGSGGSDWEENGDTVSPISPPTRTESVKAKMAQVAELPDDAPEAEPPTEEPPPVAQSNGFKDNVGMPDLFGEYPSTREEMLAWKNEGKLSEWLSASTSIEAIEELNTHGQALCITQEEVFDWDTMCAERIVELERPEDEPAPE